MDRHSTRVFQDLLNVCREYVILSCRVHHNARGVEEIRGELSPAPPQSQKDWQGSSGQIGGTWQVKNFEFCEGDVAVVVLPETKDDLPMIILS